MERLILASGWGVGDEVRSKGVMLDQIRILRWQNGKTLGSIPVDKSHGDQTVVHRADLHFAILNKALELPNVNMRLGSTVIETDFDEAFVTLSDGEKVQGDVVLGADGIKSFVRGKILGDAADVAIPTGDATFRAILPRKAMESDPELRPYIDELKAHRWVGPGCHIISYPIKKHEMYNMVMVHPDRGGVEESWTTKGSKSDVLREYDGWDPTLVKMLKLVPEGDVLEWKLCTHLPLKTWVKGSCALLGDACHPML